MLKKEITYPDLDGNLVKETFYFNLSKIELAEMDVFDGGGLAARLRAVGNSSDGKVVYPVLKEIILMAIGQRSEDGKRFEKSEQIRNNFTQSAAYETFIFEMLKDATKAAEFMNSVIPPDIVEKIRAGSSMVDLPELPAKPKTVEDYTMTELTNMPYPEFEKLMNGLDFRSLPKDLLVLAMQRKTSH